MFWFSQKRTIALFLIPTLSIYIIFIIWPLISTFYYSITDFSGMGKASYIGLKNYSILAKDTMLFVALKNTFIVFLVSILVLLPASFGLSLLLNLDFRGNVAAKALSFSPNVIAPILVGLMWVFILDPSLGLLNAFFRTIGLESLTQTWIGGRTLTPYSVGFVYVWQKIGFHATIFLAGLKSIPNELYEAAKVDGANSRQQLWRITMPMMRNVFLINAVLIITNSFKVFETVLQLTNGGPNHLSELLVTYMYYITFTSYRYGYGMSIAVFSFLISALFSAITILSQNRKGVDKV